MNNSNKNDNDYHDYTYATMGKDMEVTFMN